MYKLWNYIAQICAFNTRDDPDGSRTAEKLRIKDPMCSFMNFVVPVTDPFVPTMGNGLDRSFMRPYCLFSRLVRRRRPVVIPTERYPVLVGNDLFINWNLSSIKLPESASFAIAFKYIVDSVIYTKEVAYNVPFIFVQQFGDTFMCRKFF